MCDIILHVCVLLSKFPKANVGNILSKLRSIPEEKQREIGKFLALIDPSNTGFIPYESFRYSNTAKNKNSSILPVFLLYDLSERNPICAGSKEAIRKIWPEF